MSIEYEVRIVGQYDSDVVSYYNSLSCPEETRTRQEFKYESDINTIIDQFGIGEHPIDIQNWKTNVDIYDAVNDYQTALNQLVEADRQFMSLPAKIRSRFDNDPAQFVDFVSDEANAEELIQMGLANPRIPSIDKLASVPSAPPTDVPVAP